MLRSIYVINQTEQQYYHQMSVVCQFIKIKIFKNE